MQAAFFTCAPNSGRRYEQQILVILTLLFALASLHPAEAGMRNGVDRLSRHAVGKAAAPATTAGAPFDYDGDGDVDLDDYAVFHDCIAVSGPGQVLAGECLGGDSNGDADIDLQDAAYFFMNFTGPQTGHQYDLCATPRAVQDGVNAFDNFGAATDGPDEPEACNFFGLTHILSDVWFCYTATCSGAAVASLCGSDYDTKMAVYEGCDCPGLADDPLDCSDDDCGIGVENVQSRVTWQAITGQSYMIRVGGFSGDQGEGILSISCGDPNPCGLAPNDCTEASGGTPGCNDGGCCNTVCTVDQFCCDVDWDDFCAGQAEGLCDGHFASCDPGSGSCDTGNGSPGCANVACCNSVCAIDPYCCILEWDFNCAAEADAICALTCNARAGDCFQPHGSPGCNNVACCQLVCPFDPFCCQTEWDAQCASVANDVCN